MLYTVKNIFFTATSKIVLFIPMKSGDPIRGGSISHAENFNLSPEDVRLVREVAVALQEMSPLLLSCQRLSIIHEGIDYLQAEIPAVGGTDKAGKFGWEQLNKD